MELEVDGTRPVVEGYGTDDSRGGVGGGGLGDCHVGFGAEEGAGVLVDLVEGVGFVHVGDRHVAVAEAVAVDMEDTGGIVAGCGGAGRGRCRFAHRRGCTNWSTRDGCWRPRVGRRLVLLGRMLLVVHVHG